MDMSKTGRYYFTLSYSSPDTPALLNDKHESEADEDIASIERALAAYHFTVAMEYGREEADKAAEDWIDELQKSEADENTDWRSVTAAAAHRLACRVAASAQL